MSERTRPAAPTLPEGEAAPNAATGLELFLLKLRYKEGRLLTVEGNSPILLDDPANAWVVYTGKVDVFMVPLTDGQPAGARRHLLRAEPGTVLFGVPPTAQEAGPVWGWLASGQPDTQLLRVRLPRLRALAADLEWSQVVAGLLDNWVAGLTTALTRELPPRTVLQLEPGQEIALRDREAALPRKGVLWVTAAAGQVRYLDQPDPPPTENVPELSTPDPQSAISNPQSAIPLTRQTWLRAVGPARLAAVDTATWMRRDPEWTSLAAFHELALTALAANTAQDTAAEREWLEQRAAIRQTEVTTAITPHTGLLEAEPTNPFVHVDHGAHDPLLAACTVVGHALDIEIMAPSGPRPPRTADAIRAIAEASAIRARSVGLHGGWWRHDGGPLLAFRAADDQPVALLPRPPSPFGTGQGYEIADPVAQTRAPVTAANAATLAPLAYTFTRPFPARSVGIRDLLEFGLRDCRGDLGLIVGLGLAMGLLGLVPPLATGFIFDTLIPNADSGQLLQIGLALLVIAGATALFQVARGVAVLRVEGRLDSSIQAAVWDRLLALPVPFYHGYSAGDLGLRALGTSAIRRALSGPVTTSILSAIFSLFNLGLLFYLDVRLAVVAGGLVLATLVITTVAGAVQLRYERQRGEVEGELAGLVLQLISGLARFRVAGAEGRAFALWAKGFSEQKRLDYAARRVQSALTAVNAALPIVTTLVLFALAAASLRAGLSTGEFLAFLAAFSQLLFAALDLSAAAVALLNIVPDYEGVQPILRALPEGDRLKLDPGELSGALELSHVSFGYGDNGPLILRDLSFAVRPGELVALVGPSGSGKSTLFRLLLGFETPAAGAIYFDGHDLARLDPRAVRQQIGVVLQDGRLMAGTLWENIVGVSGATLDEAWDALRMAGLEEDIQQMPLGLHTIIGAGGGELSGGQRQRLLIARALIKKPRLLFFDEATSALDNRTQAQIGQSLAALQATRLVIAHRLSTVINADRILVLDGGRVVQQGTYAELLEQPGLFADLAKRQLA